MWLLRVHRFSDGVKVGATIRSSPSRSTAKDSLSRKVLSRSLFKNKELGLTQRTSLVVYYVSD